MTRSGEERNELFCLSFCQTFFIIVFFSFFHQFFVSLSLTFFSTPIFIQGVSLEEKKNHGPKGQFSLQTPRERHGERKKVESERPAGQRAREALAVVADEKTKKTRKLATHTHTTARRPVPRRPRLREARRGHARAPSSRSSSDGRKERAAEAGREADAEGAAAARPGAALPARPVPLRRRPRGPRGRRRGPHDACPVDGPVGGAGLAHDEVRRCRCLGPRRIRR